MDDDDPPEVAVDDVDWSFGDSTLLDDPRHSFQLEELLALARAIAHSPRLVHRRRRRELDSEALAWLFGLEGVGADIGGSSSAAGLAADGGMDQEPGYVTVEPEELDYVLVGTADEVERERRREAAADPEAELEAGWNDLVRWIEQLLDEADAEEAAAPSAAWSNYVRSIEQLVELDEADHEEPDEEEEDAITARRKDLVRDIDQSLEEEAGVELDAG